MMSEITGEAIIFIQARMGSSRFPGKSLSLIAGKPLLQHLTDRLRAGRLGSELCLLTSTNSEDDALESFARSQEIPVFRGHPTNVALRFVEALRKYTREYFVRVNGDSPLLDADIVESVTNHTTSGGFDFGTTAGPKRYPSGMNVEVLRTQLFMQSFPKFTSPDHFEHVTRFFYTPEFAPVTYFAECPDTSSSKCRFTVDYSDDVQKIEMLLDAISTSGLTSSLSDYCKVYQKLFEEWL